MTPERWREIERVCSLTLEREPGERQAFVRAACARDEDLRLEVESLLRSRDRAADFLERPALDVVARAAALLSLPHVVAVYDFGVADDGHLSPSRAGHILSGVGSAVALAHRHRLLHRDLKPENVFLHQAGDGERAKVLDFGLVKPLAPTRSDRFSGIATGGLLGTFGYMSPEQLRGEPPSESWDIWSLAVVTFEMLAGQHPFPATDGPGRSFDAEAFSNAQALTPAVTAFFERAFSADRAIRPASVEELLSRFEVAVAGLSCDL